MATVARLLPHTLLGASASPPGWPRRQIILVADDVLTVEEVQVLFPGVEKVVAVRDATMNGPCHQAPRVSAAPEILVAPWRSHDEEGFDASDQRLLRMAGSTVVFLKPHAEASGRMLRALRRCGVHHAIFDEYGRWRRVTISQALVGKARWIPSPLPSAESEKAPLNRLGSVLDRTVLRVVRSIAMEGSSEGLGARDEERSVRLARSLAALRPPASSKRVSRIVHFVSSLDSGGAERQVVNLAIAQHERSLKIHVRTQTSLAGERAHYGPLLTQARVSTGQAGAMDVSQLAALTARIREREGLSDALRCLPPSIRGGVLDIFGELMLLEPHVLHCWLDEPNVLGGLAGLLAGTPRIILSTRNVSPTHFPHLHRPWMRRWYAFLARQANVVLAGNSKAGVEDYARWLGLDPSRFVILRNAVAPEAFIRPAEDRVAAFRAELNVVKDQPLVAGIMRLSAEKRPDVFVETIRRVRLLHPRCAAVVAGVGPLDSDIRRRLAALNLTNHIVLLGQRRDVATILAAADVVLLTSDQEGTANCLLEALALGKPVVATDVGGTSEVVRHEVTGLLTDREDVGALSAAVSRLLNSPELSRKLGEAGRAHVRADFALDTVVRRTLAAYIA